MVSFGFSPHILVRIDAQITGAKQKLESLEQSTRRFRDKVTDLGDSFRRLDRIWALLIAGTGLALVRTFTKMVGEMQKIQLQVGVFERDIAKVPVTMEKVLALVDKVPFTLNTMTQAFVRLKASGIEPIIDDQGNGPLRNLADAVAAFGGGDEIFKRATIAIQQMAGKGVISMEELRQQLGEAIPTAMRVMSQQLGISVAEMIRTVSRGELEFEEGFNALIAGFGETFGGVGELMVNTIEGQFLQFQKEFQKIANAFVTSGGADVITAAFKFINEEIGKFGKELTDAITPQNIEKFLDAFDQFAITFSQAIQPARDLLSIIGTIIETVASIANVLPPEIVGGGILGFIIFGRKGLAIGAIFGSLSEELKSIIELVGKFIKGLASVLQSALGTNFDQVLKFGLVGFLIAGPKGALVGALLGLFSEVIDSFQFMVAQAERLFSALGEGLSRSIKAAFTGGNIRKAFAEGFLEAAREVEAEFLKEHGQRRFEEVFGESSVLAKQGADSIRELGAVANDSGGETISFFQRLSDSVRSSIEEFSELRTTGLASIRGLEDIGGPSPAQITHIEQFEKFLASLEVKLKGAGNELDNFRAKTEQKIGEIIPVITALGIALENLPPDDSRRQGIEDTIVYLQGLVEEARNVSEAFIDLKEQDIFENITSQLTRFNAQMEVFTEATEEGFDVVDQQVKRVEARFAGYQRQLDQIGEKAEKFAENSEYAAEVTELLRQAQEALNVALGVAIRQTERQIELKKEKIALDIEDAIRTQELAIKIQQMELAYDEAGLAGLRAEQKILDILNEIDDSIANVNKQLELHFITEEQASAWIARLQATKDAWIEMADEIIERAKFNASDFGRLMNKVASSLESSIADVFESIVRGTKSAKEILLDFYASITRAVAEYLAKQALIGIFGGSSGDGLGSILAAAFGGAATGAQFTIGGVGGTDSQLVAFRATPGEVVSVDTPGRSVNRDKVSGGGGDHFTINIQALDAASVRRLFMREGSGIIESLLRRKRLNRMPL